MSKLLRFYTGIILHAFLVIPAFSNAQAYAPDHIVPPSPTASSLGQYGNINVGYYNGTPDISVPLYTIKTSDNSLDLTLRYDASGIKVSQDASWVGLNWSLAAGGVITSTKRGIDDFAPNNFGYHLAPALPPSNDDGSYQYYDYNNWYYRDMLYFDDVLGEVKDGEPDIFCFNFGKYAGKFVLGKESDGSIVYMADQNNLKVEHIAATNDWQITDADGYKYYFSTKEIAYDYYYLNTYSDNVDPLGKLNGFGWSNYNPTSTTAWYLDAITSPRGETITFEYERKESLSIISKAEQKYKMLNLNGYCEGGGYASSTLQGEYNKFNATRQKLDEPVLRKINFPLGSVEFITSTREDIDYLDESKRPVKLSTVFIKDLTGNVVKRYELNYSYFGTWQILDDYTSKRLKLDGVTEYGSDGTAKPPYLFTYRNPNNLANKYSKGIDHWGFDNGQVGNNSLLPRMDYPGYNLILDGANREPDVDNLYAIDGTLTSITYPTGGHTDFNYELHDYYNITQEQHYEYTTKFVTLNSPSHGYSTTTTFTVPYDQEVTFGFSYDPDDCTDCSDNLTNAFAYVEKDGQMIGYWGNYSTPSESISAKTLFLTAGTYTMICYSIYGYTTNFGANWKERTLITTNPLATGGGIRIKSITNYDNAGVPSIRTFSYKKADGSSSGQLLLHPSYSFNRQALDVEDQGCTYTADYIARFSSTVNAVGVNSKSGVVAYDQVTENLGANGENGRIEYYFHNSQEGHDNYPFMPTMQDPQNGELTTKIVYNAAGDKVQKTDYMYMQNSAATFIKGVKIFVDAFDKDGYPDEQFNTDQIRFYENQSVWMVLWQQTETTYSPTGDPLTVTTNNFYDNADNKSLTRQEVVNSANDKLVTKFKYPSDYTTSTGSNTFIAKLKAQHIIAPVIEQQTFIERDGVRKLVSGMFNEYKLFNNSFYKPDAIYKLVTNAPSSDLTESSVNASDQVAMHPAYQQDISLDAYTSQGNINQQHKVQDINHSYIWDYKETFPVAEVTNASQADIAFTSFEADGLGNWVISGGTPNTTDAITGRKSYDLGAGASITRSGLNAQSYVVSYWVKNSTMLSVNGSGGTAKAIRNGWTYIEHTVTGSTITVTGTGTIDELRLYPVAAKMTTYTYDPLIGMTSQCDATSRISYFEYDAFGRLSYVRDQDKNILKRICYNYAGQQSACNVQ